MGISASLFHNSSNRENTLSYRIRPSDEQVQEQQERWNDLADFVKEKLRDEFGKPVSSWLQGSYKFGTQIRPAKINEEFDIDLGVYIEWEGNAENGDVGPQELKDRVQDFLIEYAEDEANDASETTEPKMRCNRIRFSGDFHIDIPSYHLDPKRDARKLATEDGDWETSDPKAIYVWWKDQFEGSVRDRARRIARYFKMWAALTFENGSRPSSILLSVLVAKSLRLINENVADEISGDDEYFLAVAVAINEMLADSSVVSNPANTNENLNRLSDSDFSNFRDQLGELLSVAERALRATDEYESADIWSELFKHFFPFPVEEEDATKMEDVRNQPLAVVRCDPDVAILATNKKRRWQGFNKIGPIPRGCDIRFKIANPEIIPEGAKISWTVRNEGIEAETVNDLGHVAGSGFENNESSAYRGSHYMDVVVKLNGRVVGRRRVNVKVSGLGIPPRNAGRPSWVALRKKRR